MEVNNELSALQTKNAAADDITPRKLTFGENAVLTVKVLVVAGLILAALWGLNVWVTPD
jgi:hypothetical protein